MIRKLSDPISPLERNPQSPKGWKNRESDCIGLRIVLVDSSLELQKGSDTVKYHHVSVPISIGVNKRGGFGCDWRCCDEGRSEKRGGIFCGSPTMETEDLSGYRIADFLSFCYLCRKRLDGKDIYMYRGEKDLWA
ncbi:uncharacterized protein LOC109833602 [Asparagus officinalis]|uniref:uncharacterized protein LOC109833602 n=1 Tax=Asparagus officinalis TaxID=4686 RepID=UPI00098E0D98|nr:uncharacterized protein LOC109833602 [Asparagus officinalis]